MSGGIRRSRSRESGSSRRSTSASRRALVARDILNEIFSYMEPRDARTTASITQVNRLWWNMGFPRLYGQSEGQLSGLDRNVSHPARRQMYANTVRHIHMLPGDMILANNRRKLETLDFPRLESLTYYYSNLIPARRRNIEALMVPTLRTVQLGEYEDDGVGDHGDQSFGEPEELERLYVRDEDHWEDAFFTALTTVCASLTTLTLPFTDGRSDALILDLLDRLTAIEHLDLGGVSTTIAKDTPQDVLLHKLFCDKRKLITLSPPRKCEFESDGIQAFLRRVGPKWSLPSLRSFVPGREHAPAIEEVIGWKTPTFICSMAAAQFFDCMPNLERLNVNLDIEYDAPSAALLRPVMNSISRMSHLRELTLSIRASGYDVDGGFFVELGNLSDLEALELYIYRGPNALAFSGTQFAAFLAGVPKLKKLDLKLGKLDVPCTPAIKTAIEAAIAGIEEVDLDGITLVATDEDPAP